MSTINKHAIKEQFGWSEHMIYDLLGEAHTYDLKRVCSIRKSKTYSDYVKRQSNTPIAYEQTIHMALHTPIELTKPVPHLHLLHEDVINTKKQRTPEVFTQAEIPEHVMQRWYVNRLRHKYTPYDNLLQQFTNFVGGNVANKIIKYRVYKMLKGVYNRLLDEEIDTQVRERTSPLYNDLSKYKDVTNAYGVLTNMHYFYTTN